MADTLKPIKPDFSLPWVRGWEHVSQEGSSYWRKLREARGWTRDDVYELTDWMINPATQALIEQEYGPCMPDREELEYLAFLYGRKPGEMLDECYEEIGRVLAAEAAD